MEKKQKDRKRFVDPVLNFFKANAVPLVWWIVLSIISVVAVLIISIWGGEGLARNLIFVVTAAIGLPLAIWRSSIANRQSKAAQQQSETAQRSLLNERYQKGAEMLGSEVLSARLGGIYALENLAKERAEDYHIQIIKLFCAFVRKPHPPRNENDTQSESDKPQKPPIYEDVQAIMTALGTRNNEQRKIEKQEMSKKAILDLAGANLSHANLTGANLSGVGLAGADLSGAMLHRADLSDAGLPVAKLSDAWLHDADLSGALLYDTNLSGAKLHRADLSNAVLDRADLSRRAELTGAKLSDADLRGADLSDAYLEDANLSGAWLEDANLSDAMLHDANLSGARLESARGLTQSRLDEAVADPDNPPNLTNAKDSKTGEDLVWDPTLPHRLPENLVKT